MSFITISSFLFFTILVAVISYYFTRKEDLSTQDGYYLGGRSLNAWVIAGSLILTDVSTQQLIGLSEQGFTDTLAVMGWEVGSAIALVAAAIFLLPRYLKGGITTIPDFLKSRYDFSTMQTVNMLFLFGFIFNLLPPVLYSGAVAFNALFNVEEMLGIGRMESLYLIVFAVGTVGALYAIFGGLKAVAVSDSINGIGLLVMGSLIPILGLVALGDGSFSNGISSLFENHPEKLNAVGGPDSPVPFSTLFTGMILVNLFYWGAQQNTMQRVLAARNLKEGQKGLLIAGFFKLISPALFILPGIIAFHMFGSSIVSTNAYPALVREVLPTPLTGLFAAVLFGAILTSFNSGLNSTVTLISLNVYKPYFNPQAPDKEVVRKGKYFGTIIAILAMAVAPLIDVMPQGFFQYVQTVNGFFNVPIFTILVVGYLTKRVPAIAAKISLFVFISIYAVTQLFWDTGIHFLHILGILFVLCTILMLIIGKIMPADKDFVLEDQSKVDLTPWKLVYPLGLVVIASMVIIYILFSPIGII